MISRIKYFLTCVLNCIKRKDEEYKTGVDDQTRRKQIFVIAGTSEYFWPNLSRREGECILESMANGTFLVSYHDNYNHFEMIYKRGGIVANMKIDFNDKEFSLDHKNPGLPKANSLDGLIIQLIDKCKDHYLLVSPQTGQNIGMMKLIYPLKRNITLKDHCKREILRNLPMDGLKQGDLPWELVKFLKN